MLLLRRSLNNYGGGIRMFSLKSPLLAKAGPSKIKDVVMSWMISRNDLEGQKLKAIESILRKGNKLQIKLENKTKKGFYQPTDNELEARNLLLQKVSELVDKAGGKEAQKAQGNVRTRMLLYYEPKPTIKS